MSDLALSYNLLTGTIPTSIQMHAFTSLDLSNNRLHGTLIDDFYISPNQTTLGLAINRLSGPLPKSLKGLSKNSILYGSPSYQRNNMSSLNILASNIFDCTSDEIPPLDVYSQSYSCGSYELDIAAYIWVCFAGFAALLLLIILYIWRNPVLSQGEKTWSHCMNGFMLAVIVVGDQTSLWWQLSSDLLLLRSKQNNSSQNDENRVTESSKRGSDAIEHINSSFVESLEEVVVEVKSSNIDKAENQGRNTFTDHRIRQISTAKRASSMADTFITNTSYLGLFETRGFLIVLDGFKWSTIIILICIVVAVIPVYASIGPISSIVTYQYGYILSVAFLHGYIPVVFVGGLLFALLLLMTMSIYVLRPIFAHHFGEVTSPSDIDRSMMYRIKKYSILFLLHIINVIVTVAVNTAYVNAILSNERLTRSSLLLIQVCVGLFKIVWNSVYVPWASRRLSFFMSLPRSMQNRFIMSITNFIVAPCIATLIVNQSCFYFVFKSADSISSYVFINLCELAIPCVDQSSQTIAFTSSFVPSFQYSYACGSALLVSYTPVLLYTYVANGFIVPVYRYLLSIYPSFFNLVSFSLNLCYWKSEKASLMRVRGRDIIIMNLLHLTVLFTFGLASPILGITVIFAILADYLSVKILIGRCLAMAIERKSTETNLRQKSDNRSKILEDALLAAATGTRIDADQTTLNPLSSTNANIIRKSKLSIIKSDRRSKTSESLGNIRDSDFNTFEVAQENLGFHSINETESDRSAAKGLNKSSSSQSLAAAENQNKSKSLRWSLLSSFYSSSYDTSVTVDINILEFRDMRDSWRGLFACYKLMIFTVSIFWSLLFFDMLADSYNIVIGGVVASYGLTLPFVLLCTIVILYFQKKYGKKYGSILDSFERYLIRAFNIDILNTPITSQDIFANKIIELINRKSVRVDEESMKTAIESKRTSDQTDTWNYYSDRVRRQVMN